MSNINIDRRRTLLATITLFDFIIVNLVGWLLFLDMGKDIPTYFHTYTRIVVVLMNVSVLISEVFSHSIIHFRLLRLVDVSLNVFRLTLTFTAIFAVLMKLIFNDVPTLFSIIFFFSAYLLLMLSRIGERAVLNHLRSQGYNVRRVLFVGDDPALVELHNEMMNENDRSPLTQSGVDIVFCSLPHEMGAEVERVMRSCDKNVAYFYYVPRTFVNSKVRLRPIRMGEHIFFTNHRSALILPHNRFIKRTFDIVVSLIACVFIVPLTLIVGTIIKIQSPGPIFFKQQRTGLNGKTFWCYKFRSMHVNKDADSKQATENDPRKFPFGNFIRKYNIDELPQFFNVLIGNMSLVGPRPHMLAHTEMYGKLIDKYMVRHFCKPGITGWAQVTGCRGETKELWQMEERIQRDIWYMEHWNVGLDLKIMAMTFRSFFVHDEHAY